MIRRRIKPSYERAQLVASAKNGLCKSTDVKSARQKLIWECELGHSWEASYDSVRRGAWCGECAGVKKLSIEVAREHAKTKGGKCLSKIYRNGKQPLLWECSLGHRWKQNLTNVRHGTWCARCHAPGTGQGIKEMRELASRRGGKCLSKTYSTARSGLRWQCRNLHTPWIATPDTIKRGSWCPSCADGLGERICRSYFEAIFETKFPSVRPDFLRNVETGANLELDGFSSRLKIAFEHQGRQHYRVDSRFASGRKGLRRRQRTDRLKKKLCDRAGVRLIEVPSVPDILPLTSLLDFLYLEFSKANIQKFRKVSVDKIDLSAAYSPSNEQKLLPLRKLARERGGRCLSDIYLGVHGKLIWQCSHAHPPWSASPAKVLSGRWCPECGGTKKKTIEKAQDLAKSFGATCLSKKYLNGKSKLRWRCRRGHVWMATMDSLTHGSRCPECFNVWRKAGMTGLRE